MSTPMPFDELCSLERLRALHDLALQMHPGPQGVLNPGCDEGGLGAAWNAVGYDELGSAQPHLVFASYVLYYFVTNQCFVEGNKRTGWLAFTAILSRIDLTVEATQDEVVKFVYDVANKVIPDVRGIMDWAAPRLRELEQPPARPDLFGRVIDLA
ncbi:putative Doc-like toxin [Myxococcus phage Mx9]|nr:putative Doc-like toxin [Myxococcus phage Mx9]